MTTHDHIEAGKDIMQSTETNDFAQLEGREVLSIEGMEDDSIVINFEGFRLYADAPSLYVAPENVLPVNEPKYPDPPEDLADAWRRFQEGEHVSQGELRQLDEWRADVHEDVFNGYSD
jgi:hypothetical protein